MNLGLIFIFGNTGKKDAGKKWHLKKRHSEKMALLLAATGETLLKSKKLILLRGIIGYIDLSFTVVIYFVSYSFFFLLKSVVGGEYLREGEYEHKNAIIKNLRKQVTLSKIFQK